MYGSWPAPPPAKFVAVVAEVADVALVAVAMLVAYANAEPFQDNTLPVTVGAVTNEVVATADWYGIWLATPAAMLVAVVALVAAPLKVAVIVPAEKLPEASLATTLEAVLAEVASTVAVTAAEPLKLVPVRYVPKVRALATEPAAPAIAPVTADPAMAMLVLVTEVT